ncbi:MULTISPECIES: aldose epimerase family protein [Mediterraneibacter]|jgi:galactose mutarotase-like enzyme/nitroreductase|uniref:aldose epimerase family protein n=1 Tax=Mediterraneibacter TaxID=2316020 RepID=UPI000E4BAD68|nr:nitroreductase family protein [Mediterraneibacter massiliensis]RGT71032.1 hypothetical protein DWX08_13490 [Ruminococcus sp. AF18-22]
MKTYNIRNEYVSLTVSELGAEVISLQDIQTETEFIWQGDTRYWNEHSPLLFPAVGDWKDNQYEYEGKIYQMPLHGFARYQKFSVISKENQLICILCSNEETRQYYPFSFSLKIVYSLDKNIVHVEQYISNTSDKKMPYSIGEHIGFRLPLHEEEAYEDYYVEFEKEETACRYPLMDGRMIGKPIPCLEREKSIKLKADMFENGAWNFEGLSSERVYIKSVLHDIKVILDFPDFSHFSLWSIPSAPYLCLEPCNGMAGLPSEGADPFKKRGIHILDPGKEETAVYSISIENNDINRKLKEEFENSIIEKRNSVRKFLKRVVTKEKIKAILRHAMTAPSAGNNREWEFFVVSKKEDKKRISLMSPYAGPAAEAGALIIPCMNREVMKKDKQGNMWWIQDLAACAQTILLAAKEEGIDGVWMGMYPDSERVKKLSDYLKCGEKLVPFAVIAVGYAGVKIVRREKYDEKLVHYI